MKREPTHEEREKIVRATAAGDRIRATSTYISITGFRLQIRLSDESQGFAPFRVRTGQGSTKLSRAEFEQRYKAQFFDPLSMGRSTRSSD
jgi:hypothetical protein